MSAGASMPLPAQAAPFAVYRDMPNARAAGPRRAIAIGNFDGLHTGHRAVLSAMLRAAQTHGLSSSVLTFEPHPRMFFNPGEPSIRLMPFAEKARALRAFGVREVFALRFNRAMMEMEAEDFVNRILLAGCRAGHVVTGQGFVFGHRRGGTVHTLAAMAERHGFTTEAIAPVMVGDDACSSTRVRRLLASGELEVARALLGADYVLSGLVVPGDGRGRQIGFATANVHLPPKKFLPADGVYAVWLEVDGARLPAVANLGVRPTFGALNRTFEVHALEGGGEWYGKTVRVHLVAYLRGEKRFDGIGALQEQIRRDMDSARQRLRTP